MNELYEALEICLKEIEQGADVDSVLFRYPELADELRPILETAVKAKAMAAPAPSQEVLRRNRAKLLQRASEMREQKAAPVSRRIWSVPLRRALVTFVVVAMLFVSGTGLVRASSSTLPGDNLYPVKRTWENVLLLLTFDTEKRETLEFEHENERLDELNELLAEGRSAKVDFAGYVTRQAADEWRVSGVTVFLSSDTRLPDQPIAVGAAVRVRGQIQGGGVAAERIELLPSGSRVPEVEDDESKFEGDEAEDSDQQIEEESGKTSETETPVPAPTVKATATPKPEEKSFEGVVTSIQNDLIVVNGIVMDTRFAEEVKGRPSVGVFAKVEGYYDVSGIFIVIKIEFIVSNSGGGGTVVPDNSNDNNDTNINTNDNNNDGDSGGSNSNDNNNNGDNND